MKTSLMTLAALAVVSVAALPAFASVTIDDKDAIVSELRGNGIEAQNVEEWGNYVRAYVTNEDGTQVMRFFDAETLRPVEIQSSL